MDGNIGPQEAIGESEAFLEFNSLIGRAARVDRPVLVIGERGSGKELAAGRLHYLSSRWNKPLVTLNCAALPPGLIESELFGHESGSFTGAEGRRKGRFEEADGGTLFLDEIGLIPIEVQEKILRTVEYGTFQRVGSSRTVEVNVRIIGATNQNLPALCDQGAFKRDLLDRLSFEVLFLPPLRERGDDVLLLAESFALRMARELGREAAPVFSEDAARMILSHSWPGNIRELKNAVERAVYREDGPVITQLILDPFRNPWKSVPEAFSAESGISVDDLGLEGPIPAGVAAPDGWLAVVGSSADSPGDHPGPSWPRDLKAAVHELESRWLEEAMAESGGHQGRAAELLGLSYDQFRGLFRKHS
jgi:psp operon transcriptional activator